MTFDDYLGKQDHIEIEYYGKKTRKRFLSLDNVDLKGVCIIKYYKYNTEKDELCLNRADGPAYISYYEDGKLENELWYKDGQRHRLDGPAYIFYNTNGRVEIEYWYKK